MNVKQVKQWVEENHVVPIKADKTRRPSPEVDKLLVELGNAAKAIPFCAVYPADGSEPIILRGPISKQQVLDSLKQAGPSKKPLEDLAEPQVGMTR